MKFLYADSIDMIDPEYNFLEDRSRNGRRPYWDDLYSHQCFDKPPFDGYLVSRGIVGDHKFPGKYTQSQAMRFRREGMKNFFRLKSPEHDDLMLMGDCGAFSYKDMELPPYTPAEVLEFYEDAGFTHGCSVDHLIFDFERDLMGMEPLADPAASKMVKLRYDITLENAEVFLKESAWLKGFTPMGVVQGWSPGSMAVAARKLVSMGYDYLAIGGMVPLNIKEIVLAVSEIRANIPDYIKLHILGFGKIADYAAIESLNVTSIDTTSPMLRAFKDSHDNYLTPGHDGKMNVYTAFRIPQATVNRGLTTMVKKGQFTQEYLIKQEQDALSALRDYDQGRSPLDLDKVVNTVLEYTRSQLTNIRTGAAPGEEKINRFRREYTKMLSDMPWKKCACDICQKAGIEVAIFRASNRNKRRGMHNMWVFNQSLKHLIREDQESEQAKLHSCSGTTKQ